jgi:hypothetical protein
MEMTATTMRFVDDRKTATYGINGLYLGPAVRVRRRLPLPSRWGDRDNAGDNNGLEELLGEMMAEQPKAQ